MATALIAAAAALLGVLITGVVTVLTTRQNLAAEQARAEGQRAAEAAQRAADEERARRERLEEVTEQARAAVLEFGVTARLILEARRPHPIAVAEESAGDLLKRARAQYTEALKALARLRPLCPVETRAELDALNAAVSGTFSHVQPGAAQTTGPEETQRRILEGWQVVSDTVLPGPPLVPAPRPEEPPDRPRPSPAPSTRSAG
ncbi:NADH dehydrogenase/NADH:ubiquinone oxidoreductase subunit G [Actinomadura namibiensis]|uniref:NADH dehydrogenase/NADH:ubiquinone oxidoreductase subunit G n=1 Tax=Actinomadura namibiensis TaxID=182080 RepID=A0A7W3LPN2_ACTNM|nr:NADH dehydrogenase/NADH:ubiquinone oxidoreductase subunit G [Actinomadura namibiensis]